MPEPTAIITANGGLRAVQIDAPAARGVVYLHGAHVASWIPAGADRDVLWLSEKSHWAAGKPIRGGVPICFPWFGSRKDDPAAPAHGFARLKDWTLESTQVMPEGAARVTLLLQSDDDTRRLWPHDFSLRMHATFGKALEMRLELTNTGDAPLTAEEALHTYFAVADARTLTIRGLTGARYIDKVDGMKEKTQEGSIRIIGETDRVYANTTAEVIVEDSATARSPGRHIHISKEGSADTVVWNPWIAKAKAMADFGDDEWPGMLCVETCNVMANALRLTPGQSASMTARVRIHPES
jgi:glucose-6-phosphate 1-epimerase